MNLKAIFKTLAVICTIMLYLAPPLMAGCKLVIDNAISIPLLPDMQTETTYLFGDNHIKVSSEDKSSLLVKLVDIDMGETLTMLYDLANHVKYSIDHDEKSFTIDSLIDQGIFYDSLLASLDTMQFDNDIKYDWGIKPEVVREDSILNIPCRLLEITGCGKVVDDTTEALHFSLQCWFAKPVGAYNCMEKPYQRLMDIAGFDPFELFQPMVLFAPAFGVDIGGMTSIIREYKDFPLQVTFIVQSVEDDSRTTIFSMSRKPLHITDDDIPDTEFLLPDGYTQAIE
ncbi:MAG: hypothetical protein R3F48_03780 [Candidatus Zixiibacteriota bacterium]